MTEGRAPGTGRSMLRLGRRGTAGWDRGGAAAGWRKGPRGARLLSWLLWRARIQSSFVLLPGQYRNRRHPYDLLAGGQQCRVR